MCLNQPAEPALTVLVTDGSCYPNPGPGGWASLDATRGCYVRGGEPSTTSSRMELVAVLEGLRRLPPGGHVLVLSDSQYVVFAFAKRWLAKWAANGFVDENGAETKNLDLWMGLLDAIGRFDRVCFRWVKGHAGMPANELVDVLAGRARGETKTESWGSGGWVPATKFQLSSYWMGGEDG